MTYECLLYDVRDGVATLTLNRPDRLNICFETEDAAEGIRAFGEKRVPVFQGR